MLVPKYKDLNFDPEYKDYNKDSHNLNPLDSFRSSHLSEKLHLETMGQFGRALTLAPLVEQLLWWS